MPDRANTKDVQLNRQALNSRELVRRAAGYGRRRWAVFALLLVMVAGVARMASGSAAARVTAGDCGGGPVPTNTVCPAPADAAYPYLASLTSLAASNGIVVTFTDAGLEHAATCEGAGELATMVARLFASLPPEERGEESIEWAIPQMTGEIAGHARMYLATSNERIRSRANPVNIVFAEYRGTFPGGMDGASARAQQLLYASLCPAPD